MSTLVFLATVWGSEHGGINSFNLDLCTAIARLLRGTPHCVCCLTLRATRSEVEQAREANVKLLSLAKPPDCTEFVPSDGREIANVLFEARLPTVSWWVGHDLKTGPAASVAQSETGQGNLAVIVHMDPLAYEVYKAGDAQQAVDKRKDQRGLVAAANQVFGIGPKLTAAAREMVSHLDTSVRKPEVTELVPGLADIKPTMASERFTAITFGRLDPRTDRIKHGRLAVASFARIFKTHHDYLPADPAFTLVGVDHAYSRRIQRFAERQASRRVNVLPLPYLKNRTTLWETLRTQTVALMLSLHEGFGLAGWEAVSAGVPLIVSRNTGLFEFIKKRLGGSGTGCIRTVDVRGSSEDNSLHEEDLVEVSKALLAIARDPLAARRDALHLRAQCLANHFTWEETARTFLQACGLSASAHQTTAAFPPSVNADWLARERLQQITPSTTEPPRPSVAAKSLQHSAMDMTLALGAESFVDPSQHPALDPWGANCFRDLVDLLLNSKTIFFTLPKDEDPAPPQLIVGLRRLLEPLPRANIAIGSDIEQTTLAGFIRFAERHGDSLEQWLRFQILNPIVTRGHEGRLGRIITEEAVQTFQTNTTAISRLLVAPPRLLQDIPRPFLRERHHFGSNEEMLLCYAYDAYRRALNYAKAVNQAHADALYVPHELRRNALEAVTDRTGELTANRRALYSWGNYLVKILSHPKYVHWKNPGLITQMIGNLREAAKSVGLETWQEIHINVLDEKKYRQKMDDIGAQAAAAALKAGIPLLSSSEIDLPELELERLPNRAARIDRIMGYLGAATTQVQTVPGSLIEVRKTVEVPQDPAVAAWFYQSAFDADGLFPPYLKRR